MLRRFSWSAAVMGVAGWPALARAVQEGAGHAGAAHEAVGAIATQKQGVATAITAMVVFGIVVAIISVKIWPAIAKGLDERAAKIRQEIEGAEMARRQAKDALEQYQKSLDQARAEAQKMLEATRAQQAQLAADLKAKADQELALMRERAMKDIESAKRTAIAEIYTQGTELATLMASRILRRQVTTADQQQLLEESLNQLQAMKN